MSMFLRSKPISSPYLAPNRSVIAICSNHSATCRVNSCHELLKCATQLRRPLKSLSDNLASPDRTVKPDPSDQRIAQNEEKKVAQSNPHLRCKLQILAPLRDSQMCTQELCVRAETFGEFPKSFRLIRNPNPPGQKPFHQDLCVKRRFSRLSDAVAVPKLLPYSYGQLRPKPTRPKLPKAAALERDKVATGS